MKIAIGTKSKVKIEAVEKAFRRMTENVKCQISNVKIFGCEVESGVSDQPLTDSETIKGALNRARGALESLGADLGVGMEGGVCEVEGRWFLTGWVAIVDKTGKIGLASGGRLELPEKIVRELMKKEKELGDIVDEIAGLKGSKHNLGTNGVLTKGIIMRGSGFENACIEAMAKFISPEYY